MHRLYAFALLALLLCAPMANAQKMDKSAIAKKIPSAAQMLNNSAQGREFWIAIPPNEFDGAYPSLDLEIYVTASRDANVTIEHPGTGFRKTKPVKAYSITTFTTADQSANWAWEIREDERPSNQGIHITADQPISVYALNAKSVSADGYLGIPTSVWGTQYMHMSLYDFGEFASTSPWGGGFVIVAKEDNTQVRFTLKGTDNGNPAGRTKMGKKLGASYNVTLRRGQTYMVRGNGQTLNEFDFSGTVITANKPIGFFSFHQRTMIPSFPSPNNGRDHIVEMIPPMSAWGKRYVTLELQSKANRGDFFRVFAKEDNTRFKCRYTDLKDNTTYTWEGTLPKAGDFMEKENTWPPSTSIKGVAVWTADKPIFVMQYSCSSEWYGDPIFDPAMVIAVPVEQYTLETVFQTPSNVAYINNYFNILAIGDTTDPNQTKLKTIEIDGKPVWITQSTFVVNRIQNTDIYWAKIKLPPGPHHIKGETPFGGIIYGFSDFASYLWPAATALNKLDQLDTLKPLLDTVAECGDYTITATEERDQAPNAAGDSTQIDTGVNQIELDANSYNYALELITADVDHIHIEPRRGKFKFSLKVIDKSKDAFALYYVIDRAGNVAIDSLKYIAEVVKMDPNAVVFGKVRVNTTKAMTVKLINPTKRDLEVKNIKLQTNKEFKLISPSAFPFMLAAGAQIDMTFEYTPKQEIKKPDQYDIDSVLAEVGCAKFNLGWLQGQGVMPHIKVADWDAGSHQVGDTYCNTAEPASLLVENPGTDTLTISDIKNVAAPFTLTSITPALPIRIPPGGSVILKTLCYNPNKVGSDKIDVDFNSDADTQDKSNDNISEWTGKASNPGPKITDLDFKKKRQLTVYRGDIILTNTGTQSLNVTGYHTTGDVTSLKVVSVKIDGTTDIDIASVVGDLTTFKSITTLYPNEGNRIVFTVEFIPQAEADYQQLIIPTYSNSTEVVQGKAIGTGILPHIEVTGYNFKKVLQGTKSTEVGTVTIKNTSTSSDLTVQSVILPNVPSSAFELKAEGGQVMPTVADPLVIPIGESRQINAYFTADPSTASYKGSWSSFNPNYVDDVIVMADTKLTANVADFFAETKTQLTGMDTTEGEPGIRVTPIDFGDLLLCDTKPGSFTIHNPGSTPLVVTGFNYTGNQTVYVITDASGRSAADLNFFPFSVEPGATASFDVVFTPSADVAPYNLDIAVVSNAVKVESDIVHLIGKGHIVPVKFTLIGDTKRLLPNDVVDLQFDASGQMDEAKLNEFTMVVNYDPEALRYDGSFDAVGLKDWAITVTPDKDPNGVAARGQITIKASQGAGVPLSKAGVFLKLKFRVYLSAKDELPLVLDVQRSSLGSRAICVDITKEDSKLFLDELCVRDFRGVKYITKFSMRQNTPNPSTNETEIEYTMAFANPVKIVLYNSMGEEVKVLVDGVREPGEYRVHVNTAELPSGTYTYRMMAGPFVESKQMVIAK